MLTLTITVFAPETVAPHGLILGIPYAVRFADQHHLLRFADAVELRPDIQRMIERPLLDTVMIALTRLHWTYTPSPDGPERDTVTRERRTYGEPLRDFGLDAEAGLTLRALMRTVPIAQPQAILHLAETAA
jgi:hypothetical protein